MNNGLFEFKGEQYPFREIVLFSGTKNEMEVTVAGESLWEVLEPYVEDKEDPLWFEATDIDDSISFYVDDKDLSKDYSKLVKQIESSYE